MTDQEGLLKPLNLGFQQLPRKVNATFDGPQGLIQHGRNLMVFETIKIK